LYDRYLSGFGFNNFDSSLLFSQGKLRSGLGIKNITAIAQIKDPVADAPCGLYEVVGRTGGFRGGISNNLGCKQSGKTSAEILLGGLGHFELGPLISIESIKVFPDPAMSMFESTGSKKIVSPFLSTR